MGAGGGVWGRVGAWQWARGTGKVRRGYPQLDVGQHTECCQRLRGNKWAGKSRDRLSQVGVSRA